jgi:hypothetical protein
MTFDEISAIATSAVTVLAPYLNSLRSSVADKVTDATASKFVQSAHAYGKRLYDLVSRALGDDPEQARSLKQFEANPEDVESQTHLHTHLTRLLGQNETLAQELLSVLANVVASNGDVVFKTNISGNIAKLVQIGTVHGNVRL